MWISNAWNNFAPFAGFMLIGYEQTRAEQTTREADVPVAARVPVH